MYSATGFQRVAVAPKSTNALANGASGAASASSAITAPVSDTNGSSSNGGAVHENGHGAATNGDAGSGADKGVEESKQGPKAEAENGDKAEKEAEEKKMSDEAGDDARRGLYDLRSRRRKQMVVDVSQP